VLYAGLEPSARAGAAMTVQIVGEHARQHLARAGVLLRESSSTGVDGMICDVDALADQVPTLSEAARVERRPILSLDQHRGTPPRR